MYDFGEEGEYNVMIMELLGPTVEYLFKKHERIFSPETVLYTCLKLVFDFTKNIDSKSSIITQTWISSSRHQTR